MIQALRQAARSLALHPRFSIIVLLIMALCIGGNASVFSAAKSVLFQDLPFTDADRLVVLTLKHLPEGADNDVSYVEVAEFRQRSQLLEEFSPFLAWQDRILVEQDSVERIGVNFVPPSYFELLGVKPQIGRLFAPQEDGAPGSAPVIVLSHDLWQRHFAQDPGILGQKIQLNNTPYTVIGVMPRWFFDLSEGHWDVDAWIPAVQAGDSFPAGAGIYEARDQRLWFVLARIKPGVTLEQAQQEVDNIAAQLRQEFPDTNREYGAGITPVRQFVFEGLLGGIRVLLAGALFVLLIGCANIANLLLVRLAERQRELSLRLALGASRMILVREVLAQSLILAVAGGALGALLAVWGTKLLSGLIDLPPYVRIELDGGVLAVTALATLLTGLLFALPPAISVSRMDSRGTLQQIRVGAGGRTHSSRSRTGLLVFQVAFVVVLLVVAGLLLRSFQQLRSTGVDFDTDRLLTMRMAFETGAYSDRANIPGALREVVRRVESVPGVEGAAVWGFGMPGIETQYYDIKPEGAPDSDPTIRTDANVVSPGALATLGVPLQRGREFTPEDTVDKPRVVIISQSLGEDLWPGQDPVGKRLLRAYRDNETPWTVVGVIKDSRFEGRLAESANTLLFSYEQLPPPDLNLLVRTKSEGPELANAIKEAIRQVDSQIPVYDILTLEERLRDQEGVHRLNAAVVTAFSILALILAVLGLYGVLSYSVVQRTKEIGVRMALGAERKAVLGMVMGRALALVAAGLVLGLAGALALARLMSALLYGVTARDPFTILTVTLLFIGVALLAAFLPARRASKVEPTIALRYE